MESASSCGAPPPSANSFLTPLQTNAAAGLLQNRGLEVNAEFVAALDAYNGLPLIQNWTAVILSGGGANVSPGSITTVFTLAADVCAPLTDSVPSAPNAYPTLNGTTPYAPWLSIYSSQSGAPWPPSQNPGPIPVGEGPYDPRPHPGLSGLLSKVAWMYLGMGDLSKFAQVLTVSNSWETQTNIFVNTAVNSQNYLGNTFTNTNSMITGENTTINLATDAFGTDLANTGSVIDLNNLGNLGSPLALMRQIYKHTNGIFISPAVSLAFINVGISQEVVINLQDPNYAVTDAIQKLMYQAMTQITGDDLAQVLSAMGVTTVGINTMADLLNPAKLFPNSFQSLTVPTADGPLAMYTNAAGSVNPSLKTALPPYVTSSLV
jgi:hypothetical protein